MINQEQLEAVNKQIEELTENRIEFNNGKAVVDKFESQGTDYEETFLTMMRSNSFSGVEVSDENILKNSEFIVNLWA